MPYTKVPLATDNFTGGVAFLGATYTHMFSSPKLQLDGAGHCIGNGVGDAFAFDNVHAYSNDQYSSEFTFSTAGAAFDSPEPAVRCSGVDATANCYFSAWDTGNFDLAKFVAGVASDIGSFAGVNAAGDKIECWAIGTSISLVYNGTSVLTVTDTSTPSGAAGPGVGTQTAIAIDNWEGGNLVLASGAISDDYQVPLVRRESGLTLLYG